MLRVVDFQTRRVPIMACKSAIELFELDELGTLRYLLRGGEQRLDLVLSEAVVKCVSAIGFDIGKEVSELRVKEHSPSTGPKELTDFYYSSAIPGPSERAWTSRSLPTNRGSHSIYASAFWETSLGPVLGECSLTRSSETSFPISKPIALTHLTTASLRTRSRRCCPPRRRYRNVPNLSSSNSSSVDLQAKMGTRRV